MSNSKNSSDFNQIRTERGPNAESESQKLPAGWIRTGEQPDSVAKWNAEYAIPSQAAASGQAQHGVDLGGGQACGGQAIGGTFGLDVSGTQCWPDPYRPLGDRIKGDPGSELAKAILKLRDQRNHEIAAAAAEQARQVSRLKEQAQREMVAKQQSALLDEVSADAIAPASERKVRAMKLDMDDMVRFEALERQVKWLIERGNQHARQISQLLGLVSDLQAKLAIAYVDTTDGYRSLKFPTTLTPKACDGLASSVSVGPMVSVPSQWRSDVSRRVDEPARPIPNPACEHDMLKPNTTISAITRKKARCNICAQVWESA